MTDSATGSLLSDDNGIPALREQLEAFVREFGYTHYTYVSGKVIAGRRLTDFDPRERPFRLTNVPAAWQKHYSSKRYYDHDPVLLFALHNVLPESWASITERFALTTRQRRVMADADDIGLRNGIVVPVHGPGGEFSVLSLSHAETARQGEANVVTDEAAIQMFALRFHNGVRALRNPAQGEPPADLTNREIDVLFWTAEGKSTWDISQILDISEATVNFHINSAKRKLNVFSKTHAVAKMYTFGERGTF